MDPDQSRRILDGVRELILNYQTLTPEQTRQIEAGVEDLVSELEDALNIIAVLEDFDHDLYHKILETLKMV